MPVKHILIDGVIGSSILWLSHLNTRDNLSQTGAHKLWLPHYKRKFGFHMTFIVHFLSSESESRNELGCPKERQVV